MINLVHIVEDLNIGGMERIISALILGTNKDKFSIKVWCLCRGGQIFDYLKDNGQDVEILEMKSSRDFRFFLWLAKKLKDNHIDIVHTHGCSANTIGRIAAVMAFTPVIITHLHSTYYDYTAKLRIIDWILSFFTKKIICCSQAVADFARGREKIFRSKLEVVYNGVDINAFDRFVPIVRDYNATIVVGCIASLTAHKGQKYLLEAVKILKEKFNKKISLVFVGDGPEKFFLTQYSRQLNIEYQVLFKGIIVDIMPLIYFFDLVVLPSCEREGLGLVLLEAMAAAKPVIGTTVGGINEIIRDKQNGLLVPPKNALALAQAINFMLENQDWAVSLGMAGYCTVREKFSQQAMIEKIENIYNACLYKK
jgi:glycosyltransferase involved in cell wall biosynthesis